MSIGRAKGPTPHAPPATPAKPAQPVNARSTGMSTEHHDGTHSVQYAGKTFSTTRFVALGRPQQSSRGGTRPGSPPPRRNRSGRSAGSAAHGDGGDLAEGGGDEQSLQALAGGGGSPGHGGGGDGGGHGGDDTEGGHAGGRGDSGGTKGRRRSSGRPNRVGRPRDLRSQAAVATAGAGSAAEPRAEGSMPELAAKSARRLWDIAQAAGNPNVASMLGAWHSAIAAALRTFGPGRIAGGGWTQVKELAQEVSRDAPSMAKTCADPDLKMLLENLNLLFPLVLDGMLQYRRPRSVHEHTLARLDLFGKRPAGRFNHPTGTKKR